MSADNATRIAELNGQLRAAFVNFDATHNALGPIDRSSDVGEQHQETRNAACRWCGFRDDDELCGERNFGFVDYPTARKVFWNVDNEVDERPRCGSLVLEDATRSFGVLFIKPEKSIDQTKSS